MKSGDFKNPNLSILYRIGKSLEILNLWLNWENLRPNLRFTVENKIGN